MKKIQEHIIFLFFLTISLNGFSQNMFNYEREINNKENYDYQEIEFQNTDDKIKLSGTLITPKSDFEKIVIILAGSGRDSRYAHFILAEEFLKNGIAVYRFDERGVGKSEGDFSSSFIKQSNDLIFAIENLNSLNKLSKKKIGVIGHSLSGVASIDAFKKSANIDFLIQWSTPIEKNGAFLKYQISKNNKFFNAIKGKTISERITLLDIINTIILENPNTDAIGIYKKVKKIAKKNNYKKDSFSEYIMPSTLEIVRSNYEKTYQNIQIPTLYIIGSKDQFVNPKNSIKLLNSFNNKNITIKLFDGLNHFLNKLELTSMTKEVYELDERALKEIINWTLKK